MHDSPNPDLLETIYDTILDPARWPRVIEEVSRQIGGRGGQVLLWDDVGGAHLSMMAGGRSDPDHANRLFLEHYGAIDPRRAHAMSVPVGSWVSCHHICDDRFVARSELYQDYFIPVIGSRYMAGVRLADANGLHAMLAFSTSASPQAEPFDVEAMRTLQQMTPHFARAARLQLQVARLRSALAERDAALEQLGIALLVVDEGGNVRFCNRDAEAVMSASDSPLSVRLGRLRSARPDDSNRLARAIEAAMTFRQGGAVTLRAAASAAVLHCTVVPISPRSALAADWQRPLAMVLLTDPCRPVAVNHSSLRDLFGLTTAEARLATALAEGESANECADRFEVALPTVRAQIRSIFLKVGVNRRTALIALLQRLGIGRVQ